MPTTSPSASLVLSFVALAGCAPPPPVVQPPVGPMSQTPPLAPTQRFADPEPPPTFADSHRKERVRAQLAEIDHLLSATQSNGKGGYAALAAGVVVDDELVWSHGYGKRTDSGGDVDADTVFRIGSITKTFTAMAALRLRDGGRLDFARPAHDALPALAGLRYTTTDSAPITVAELLTHTSGLARDFHLEDGALLTSANTQQLLDGFVLESPPLDTLRYSNVGVGLVGLIVGQLSGKPYRNAIHDTILEPLGMTASTFDVNTVSPERLATGHESSGTAILPSEHLALGALEGAGGLYSNVRDMARYTLLQLAAWPARSDADPTASILRRSSIRESHTAQRFSHLGAKLEDGALSASAHGVGFAWQVQQSCDYEHIVWHNGATRGYTAAVFFLPRHGVGVILLSSNNRSVTGLAQRVLHAIVDGAQLEPRKPSPGAALMAHLDGAIAELFTKGRLQPSAYEAAFVDGFRKAIPLESINDMHRQLASDNGTCERVAFIDVASASEASVEMECERGARLLVKLNLDHQTPQRITGYRVQPLSADAKNAKAPSAPPRCVKPVDAPIENALQPVSAP